jgi:anthranilate phosphoribosyltransferase
VTLLNAGAGLYAANRAATFGEGIILAAEAIDSGRALAKIEELGAFTRSLIESPVADVAEVAAG